MIKLYIQHHDASVRKNLGHTIGLVWDVVTLADTASDADLVLTADKTPKHLKTIIHDLQALAAQKTWPKEIFAERARIDTMARQFHLDDATIDLTEKEIGVIVYLWRQGVATRDDLLRDVWKYADGVDTHTIETHIYRLRQKIETNPEKPVFLVTTKDGYQLAASSKA